MRNMILAATLLMVVSVQAQKRVEKPDTDVPVEQGKYTASWEGTAGWECPEWFKEVIRDWKADKWNPAYLIERYYKAGARYFMTLGSPQQEFRASSVRLMKIDNEKQ